MLSWSLICSVGAAWILMITLGLTATTIHWKHNCDDDVDWILLNIIQRIPIGEIFGGYIFCFLAEFLGRKHAVNALFLPMVISCALREITCKTNYSIAANYIRAISNGGALTILPIYLGELSEKRSRGTLISLLITSRIIGYCVEQCIFIISSAPAAVSIVNNTSTILCILTSIVFYAIAVDTPSYLIQRNKIDDAKETLNKIGNPCIHTDQEPNENERIINETVMLRSRSNGYIKAFILSLTLLLFEIVTGVYSTPYYVISSSFFGYPKYAVLGIATFGSSLVCPFLLDRIGRLSCLMISFTLMFISQLILIILIASYKDVQIPDFCVIIVLSIFCSGYWTGAITIPVVILGEIFPMKFKMILSATVTGIFFTSEFMMIMCIEYNVVGANVLLYVSVVFCLVAIVIVKLLYFETIGKSLKEIQSMLTNK